MPPVPIREFVSRISLYQRTHPYMSIMNDVSSFKHITIISFLLVYLPSVLVCPYIGPIFASTFFWLPVCPLSYLSKIVYLTSFFYCQIFFSLKCVFLNSDLFSRINPEEPQIDQTTVHLGGGRHRQEVLGCSLLSWKNLSMRYSFVVSFLRLFFFRSRAAFNGAIQPWG